MLHLHRSERADYLVEVLAEILADPLEDPFASEVVSVPTRGVERWLTQRLSHRLGGSPGRSDGVAANIEFPFPGSLVGAAVAAASGLDPRTDPWAPERAVWPLMEVVDDHLGDLFLKPLAEHLEASSPRGGDGVLVRFAAVRHVADLFDQYGVHRPALITSWARGERGEGLAERHLWQADLWRLLRERIGVESPAERLDRAVARIAGEPNSVQVPARLSLFGLTRLPASYLLVLRALAETRDIHLLLLHPSGSLWKDLSEKLRELPIVRGGFLRSDDPTSGIPKNPLLRSWGRDAREMQLVLAAQGASAGEHRPVAGDRRNQVLHRLQSAIRANVAPPGEPAAGAADERPILQGGDRSIQIHACHGRYRQVEVLRDAVLHLLSMDETLEPRDVIVMCPDVETFAPLVQAVFAEERPSDSGDLGSPEMRVRLADRSLRQTNPLLAVAAALLDLADGRLTASQMLDFAGQEPVRRRFRFDDDELSVLERWVIEM
ncbi:MAG TPA: exodeoxyribonuclease V subunit gamma, partial [Acidimicrobiales bacterium]|nr:exodeoxyribonuclease V subunit gamma [Acidimicrobiales bacterium]